LDVKPPQILFRIRNLISNDQFVLGVLAVGVGLVVGGGVVGFRLLIDAFHLLFYGGAEADLASTAAALPWWHVALAPALGGLLVGLWYRYFMPGGKPQGIANIIEATATRGSRLDIRAGFGDFPAFTVPEMALQSVLEFPAFAGLGIVAALAALVFMRAVFAGEDLAARSRIPRTFRPMAAGLVIGLLAIPFPLILGVGYEATDHALNATLPALMLVGLVIAKTLGTGIALGFGFGGGVFSPSLTVGALVGVAFGGLATAALPDLSSGAGAYALVGMGAVAASVLGAPISTVLIVFEMTHDTALTVAVMVAVVMATTITQQVARAPSFFHWQLERRGLNLKGGRDVGLLRLIRVADVVQTEAPTVPMGCSLRMVREKLAGVPFGELFVIANDGTLFGTITLADLQEAGFDPELDLLVNAADVARRHPPVLAMGDTLEVALKRMMALGEEHLAVVEHEDTMKLVGCVHETEVLLEYNRQLLRVRAEERGEGRDDVTPF